jgi:transforming growth factor-beta-induced protein
MNLRRKPRLLLVPAIALALATVACGGDDGGGSSAAPTTAAAPSTMGNSSGSMASGAMPSGPGCAAVPNDGKGSFAGMAVDPAATAASNNPVLSTLVSAVQKAGLVDTLNSSGPFTIFAPTNDAFAMIPADQLDAVLADTAKLSSILTLHVVAGEKLSSADLAEAGTVKTVNGGSLTFSGNGGAVSVNGSAAVVCADVQTANATVHIIDHVLMPS